MRAWALTALGDDRQYGGNAGYQDDPRRIYRYDSHVPNCRQLAAGDLVFIRDRKFLTGVAILEKVTSGSAPKVRRRCPTCKSPNIKERQTKLPHWRCMKDGHEFDEPIVDTVNVTTFEADYSNTFQAAPAGIPATRLKRAALRPNDQLAIEEVDPRLLETMLVKAEPELFRLFASAAQGSCPRPDDALGEADDEQDPDTSATDNRASVIASIKRRRGQKKFRDGLARRYGANCMASGCALFAIVEAAHIWPHQGDASNNLRNGLLLRADLHTLFDLDLMGINPQTLTVHFHPEALASGYAMLEGATLRVAIRHRPASNVLEDRWCAYNRRLSDQSARPGRKRGRIAPHK